MLTSELSERTNHQEQGAKKWKRNIQDCDAMKQHKATSPNTNPWRTEIDGDQSHERPRNARTEIKYSNEGLLLHHLGLRNYKYTWPTCTFPLLPRNTGIEVIWGEIHDKQVSIPTQVTQANMPQHTHNSPNMNTTRQEKHSATQPPPPNNNTNNERTNDLLTKIDIRNSKREITKIVKTTHEPTSQKTTQTRKNRYNRQAKRTNCQTPITWRTRQRCPEKSTRPTSPPDQKKKHRCNQQPRKYTQTTQG